MRKTLPAWAVCIFFAAFLALGLFTAGDYGPAWDEIGEMDILRMNLWEYADALGMDVSAFEARAEVHAALRIERLVPISQSIECDHGTACFYPLAPFMMNESFSEAQLSLLWHMWCWIIFSLGALAAYKVCRRLGLPRGWALLAPVFLLLSPRFFAQGHFNNKDIVLFTLALCTLWQALRLMERPTVVRGLCFALAGALAANTKVAGLAVWGLCGVFVLWQLLLDRRMTGRVWGVAGATFVAFAGMYALLTLALWGAPLAFLRYLVTNALSFQRWENHLLLRGVVFRTQFQQLPWYYLPYMILVTTPLWALLLIAVGTVGAVWAGASRLRKRAPGGVALWLTVLLWVLPLVFAIVTHTRVYNGWRHFYFLYGPMLCLAAWGTHALWRHMRKAPRRAFAAALVLCLSFSGVGIVTQHPYQYAYYQPLAQLRGTDYNELDYWNVSARDALITLLSQDPEGVLSVAPADYWSWDGLCKAVLVLPEELQQRIRISESHNDTDYVLSNPTYAKLYGFQPRRGWEEAVVITSYGQPIMRIYATQAKGELP